MGKYFPICLKFIPPDKLAGLKLAENAEDLSLIVMNDEGKTVDLETMHACMKDRLFVYPC